MYVTGTVQGNEGHRKYGDNNRSGMLAARKSVKARANVAMRCYRTKCDPPYWNNELCKR